MSKPQSQHASALEPQEQTYPGRYTKRIGGTTYNVFIHFSQTSRESLNDKIVRLIKNEALSR